MFSGITDKAVHQSGARVKQPSLHWRHGLTETSEFSTGKYKDKHLNTNTWDSKTPCNRAGWGMTGWKALLKEDPLLQQTLSYQLILTGRKANCALFCLEKGKGRSKREDDQEKEGPANQKPVSATLLSWTDPKSTRFSTKMATETR